MSIKKKFTDDNGKIEVGVFERIPLRLNRLKNRHREHGKQTANDTRDAVQLAEMGSWKSVRDEQGRRGNI